MATRSLLAARLLRGRSSSPLVGSARCRFTDGSVGKDLPSGNAHDGAINVKGSESDKRSSFKSVPRFNSFAGSHVKRQLGTFLSCKTPANLVLLSSCMVTLRHFASRSNDEDDVEARLMRDDNGGEGMFVGDSGYGMAGATFGDYHEGNQYGEDSYWAKGGEGADGEEGTDGEEGMSDEDLEDSGNELSDEEFEGERTDEELDELLANTPLFDPPEVDEDMGAPEPMFSFRPEGPSFYPGMEYEPEDLDITRPLPPRKREQRLKQVISVEEVIDKADFRNVRYLTKFIGETGNILARKEFKMRNKSHGRITKAIKTARFFGLMPYTNMGRPKYVFNEPFDEFSQFYETDEDEQKLEDMAKGSNYEGRFRDIGPRDGRRGGGYSGQGMGRWR